MNAVPMLDIDGKKYPMADLTPVQEELRAHIIDLEGKLRLNEFDHAQLEFSRSAYVNALKASLGAHDGESE